MAQIKISELTTLAQQLQSADYVPVVHNAATYKYSLYNYFVKNSGDETIAGVKTFSSTPIMTIQGGSASSVIDTIQLRKDTAANWTSANPVLHQGEEGLETDTGKRKTGDGVTSWNSLGYSLAPLSSTPSAGNVMVWGLKKPEYVSTNGTGIVRIANQALYGSNNGSIICTITDSGNRSAILILIFTLNYTVSDYAVVLASSVLTLVATNNSGTIAVSNGTGTLTYTCRPLESSF